VISIVDHLSQHILRDVARGADARPYTVGLAGPVGAGKSTLAQQLKIKLIAAHLKVAVISTDHFLLPNAQLAEKKILKGFPNSYDLAWMTRFFQQVSQRKNANYPNYSHQAYDRTADLQQLANDFHIVIVEGLNALTLKPLDIAIYVLASGSDCINAITTRTLQLFQQYPQSNHPLNQRPLDPEKIRQAVIANWHSINRHSSWLQRPALMQPIDFYIAGKKMHSQNHWPVMLRNGYWQWHLRKNLSTWV
jgi:hypothetical protein